MPQVGVYTKIEADRDIATHAAIPAAHHTLFDIFNKYRDFVRWAGIEDTNAWMKTIDGGGTIVNKGPLFYIETGNTSGDRAFLQSRWGYRTLFNSGGLITAEWVVEFIHEVNQTTYLVLDSDGGTPPDETYYHFGFVIINGRVWATNCDDSDQKITDTGVDLAFGHQFTRLRVVVDPGVDCKFYVNDVLKVTHTEKLPEEAEYYLNMGIQISSDATRQMRLYRFLLEKAYA